MHLLWFMCFLLNFNSLQIITGTLLDPCGNNQWHPLPPSADILRWLAGRPVLLGGRWLPRHPPHGLVPEDFSPAGASTEYVVTLPIFKIIHLPFKLNRTTAALCVKIFSMPSCVTWVRFVSYTTMKRIFRVEAMRRAVQLNSGSDLSLWFTLPTSVTPATDKCGYLFLEFWYPAFHTKILITLY